MEEERILRSGIWPGTFCHRSVLLCQFSYPKLQSHRISVAQMTRLAKEHNESMILFALCCTGQEGNFCTQSLIGELASRHVIDLIYHMATRVVEGGLYPELCLMISCTTKVKTHPPSQTNLKEQILHQQVPSRHVLSRPALHVMGKVKYC